jgi:hypothetical protein
MSNLVETGRCGGDKGVLKGEKRRREETERRDGEKRRREETERRDGEKRRREETEGTRRGVEDGLSEAS